MESLAFLASDVTRGWQVSRNPLKVLNHLDFLRGKEAVAEALRVHDRALSPQAWQVVDDHYQQRLSTAVALRSLARETGLLVAEVRGWLRRFVPTRHLEWHPTDQCNLRCLGCTYENTHSTAHYPVEQLDRLHDLAPASMIIVGGGEPTLYYDRGLAFGGLLWALRDVVGAIPLALVTNGTVAPQREWLKHFAWVRVSLDAATAYTYTQIKGRAFFDQVLENYLRYLDSTIPYVGLGFVFSRENVHESLLLAQQLYALVGKTYPQHLARVNIQYRPFRADMEAHRDYYVEERTLEETVVHIAEVARSDEGLARFLREQTNIAAIIKGHSYNPVPFARCYYAEVFRILRATGELKPCCVSIAAPTLTMGNLFTDDLETIALYMLWVAGAAHRLCHPQHCHLCGINNLCERGLRGEVRATEIPEVRADLMF